MTALIIVTYDNVDCLRRCLASARMLDSGAVVPVVVDNGSDSAGATAAADALAESWGVPAQVATPDDVAAGRLSRGPVVVRSRDNLGYARGNNLGVMAAEAMGEVEYVMFANDDVIFVDDIVPGLRRVLSEEKDCGIAGPVLYRPDMDSIDHNCARRAESVAQMISDNFLKYWWRWRRMPCSPGQRRRHMLQEMPRDKWPARLRAEMLSGACMMMRHDVFAVLGGFDPRTFLYYEENILMEKMRRAGLHAAIDTTLGAVHEGAATTSRASKSLQMMRESCRSQRIYVQYYTDAGRVLRLLHRLSVGFLLASHRLQRAVAPGRMRK